MDWSMNFNARSLEQAIMVEGKRVLQAETAKAQRSLDAVSRQYAGKVATAVEPQVRVPCTEPSSTRRTASRCSPVLSVRVIGLC